jgi:predicted nucleic acid-binding Zn ribbon protein
MTIAEIKAVNECEKCGRIVCYCGTAGKLIKPPMNPRPALEDLNEINGDVANATYRDGVLQPGCLMCGATIPEKQAKFRAKVCSASCRYYYRQWRKRRPENRAEDLLRCQVCRKFIKYHHNINWVEVCSTECRNAMRRYRFQILQNQKCPHCYHPSSEKEREEFRQWRASKGPMQEFFREAQGRGNFAWQREKALRSALKAALELLAQWEKGSFEEYAVEMMEPVWDTAVKSLAEHMKINPNEIEAMLKPPPKKKVDIREVEESTLPASGSTAQEEESHGTQS